MANIYVDSSLALRPCLRLRVWEFVPQQLHHVLSSPTRLHRSSVSWQIHISLKYRTEHLHRKQPAQQGRGTKMNGSKHGLAVDLSLHYKRCPSAMRTLPRFGYRNAGLWRPASWGDEDASRGTSTASLVASYESPPTRGSQFSRFPSSSILIILLLSITKLIIALVVRHFSVASEIYGGLLSILFTTRSSSSFLFFMPKKNCYFCGNAG